MSIRESLFGKRQEAEKTVAKKVKEYQKEETEKPAERQALVKARGAEKATKEQLYNLRKEIGEEEERQAERKAQVELMGPEKATPEQMETFAPVSEKSKIAPVPEKAKIIELRPKSKKQKEQQTEEMEYKKAA